MKTDIGWRAVLACAALTTASVQAPAAETIGEAFTQGQFGAGFRWRAEHVKQDPFENKAFGIPLRARVNFGTDPWMGLSLFVEYDYIFDFGVDTYDEGSGNTPDRGDYPVIADPAGGDLNQAFLQWQSPAGNRFRAGRQRIKYDNDRFIGNVGWRQNEQTYDAVSFQREKLGNWDLRAGYIGKVNRIFGNDVPAGEHDMDTWLANASYAAGGIGRLTGYFYHIDNDDAPGLSNRSMGARFVGDPLGEKVKFGYTLEYAYQEDVGSSPVPYDADYWRVDLSAAWDNPTLYGGYEVLGGDDRLPGQAFRTPLATLHAFNGWADKFLTTPAAGLEDLFIGVKGKLGNWSWNVLYHDFSAQSGSESFGTEWDGSIGTTIGGKLGLLLKAAKFDSDSASYGDTTKIWVMLSYDYSRKGGSG